MMVDEIPQDVQALLRDQVTSLEALSMLLLLHATSPRRWSVASLIAHTCTASEPTQAALDMLWSAGLVERDRQRAEPLYFYAASDAASGRAVDELAKQFEERRVAIISMLNTFAVERMRSAAARAFADAFVLNKSRGKEDKDG